MKPILLFALLGVSAFGVVSPPAHSACHFAVDHPIVCYQALPAALVWAKLGDDSARISKSYTQSILNQSGCGTPYSFQQIKSAVIVLREHGKIATGGGWVPVSMIEVNHHVSEIYYVADAYLSGVCAKFNPKVD